VVSASKGITLVFKNDPLQNVEVSSTFDSVEVIRGYLQQEIEGQLREMFREDLPGIIHRMSQTWLGRGGGGGKVEMPYKDNPDGPGVSPSAGLGTPGQGLSGVEEEDELDPNDPYAEKEIFPPHPSLNASPANTPQRKAIQQAKAARQRRLSSAVSESPTSYTIFPDIEDYDPTYGLRPEGVPTHSGYEAFGRLWEKARQGEGRGFGSLMQSRVEEERTGDVSDDDDFDNENGNDELDIDVEVDHDVLSPLSPRTEADAIEWETFPAVGGGVISRPRVYHSQSKIRAPSESGAMPSPGGGTGSITARASSIGASSTIGVSLPSSTVNVNKLISVEPTEIPYSPFYTVSFSSSSGPSWSRSLISSSNGNYPIRYFHPSTSPYPFRTSTTNVKITFISSHPTNSKSKSESTSKLRRILEYRSPFTIEHTIYKPF